MVEEARDDWRKNVAPGFDELREIQTDGFYRNGNKSDNYYQTSYGKIDVQNLETLLGYSRTGYKHFGLYVNGRFIIHAPLPGDFGKVGILKPCILLLR